MSSTDTETKDPSTLSQYEWQLLGSRHYAGLGRRRIQQATSSLWHESERLNGDPGPVFVPTPDCGCEFSSSCLECPMSECKEDVDDVSRLVWGMLKAGVEDPDLKRTLKLWMFRFYGTKRVRITPEERAALRQDYAEGMTQAQLMTKYMLTKDGVAYHLGKKGNPS